MIRQECILRILRQIINKVLPTRSIKILNKINIKTFIKHKEKIITRNIKGKMVKNIIIKNQTTESFIKKNNISTGKTKIIMISIKIIKMIHLNNLFFFINVLNILINLFLLYK